MFLSSLLIDVGENPDRPRPGRLWLRNLYHVHQRLCMGFPTSERKQEDPEFLKPFHPEEFAQNHVHVPRNRDAGFLFRVEPLSGASIVTRAETGGGGDSGLPRGRARIIVQSAIRPDWEYAFQNADYLLAADPEYKEFTPVFRRGQALRFRLLANAVKKVETIRKSERERLSKRELQAIKGRHGRRVPVPADPALLLEWLEPRAQKAGFSFSGDSVSIQVGYLYMKKPAQRKGQRLRAVRYDGILRVTHPEKFLDALVKGIGPAKGFGFGLLSVTPILETAWRKAL